MRLRTRSPLPTTYLLCSPRQEAGDQHRRQGKDAGSRQVYYHLCLLREEEAL